MVPWWTVDEYDILGRIARGMTMAGIPEEERCVNFAAPECVGKAEANGWCSGCWAQIAPKEVASTSETPCPR